MICLLCSNKKAPPHYKKKLVHTLRNKTNLPSDEIALADLKIAWNESIQAEEKFIKILKNYI